MKVTFRGWICSEYPGGLDSPAPWGIFHIVTLICCILLMVAIACLFRKKSEKTRRIVLFVLAGIILLFEATRRIVAISRGLTTWDDWLYNMLPRPWCAISCWLVMASVIVHKKFLYNFTSMTGSICAIIFFAYPTVGFTDSYVLFENVYSIGTHFVFFNACVAFITLRFTDFKALGKKGFQDGALKELITLVIVYAYAFIEIYVLKIATDPMYCMPNNEAQEILGIGYPLYLVLYIVFLAVYFSGFYFVQYLWTKKKTVKQRRCAGSR